MLGVSVHKSKYNLNFKNYFASLLMCLKQKSRLCLAEIPSIGRTPFKN